MIEKALYFISGASASGKTVLLKEVLKSRPDLKACFFDSMGVPGQEKMKARFVFLYRFRTCSFIVWIQNSFQIQGKTRP